jgi:predicted MPP superfamily phosphohydrolase
MALSQFKLNRRKLIRWVSWGFLSCCLLEPVLIEPYWVTIQKLSINGKSVGSRIIHLTDVHHKGNRAYLQNVVNTVNSLSPDFVCFTGDLVEKKAYLVEALEILSAITCPIYGVPGNHDYWSGASFETISRYLEATGGAWLVDRSVLTRDGHIQIVGATGEQPQLPELKSGIKRLLLVHYPLFADEVYRSFDLVLAGHSHGGQIRLPFVGALFLPSRVGSYDMGLYQTQAGSLYVNPGIGTFFVPIRLWCRPEITVVEL